MDQQSRHQCLIYDGPPSLQLPALAAALKRRLDEGRRCLYLNSPAMVAGMRSHLAELGLDVENEITRGRLVLSSEPVVSAGGDFDVEEMLHKLEEALNQALRDGFKGLWATGDMTWELGSEKNFSKLLDYEARLEKFLRERPEMSGVCQYHADTLPRELMRQSLFTHRTIFLNETLARASPYFTAPGEHGNAALDELISAICREQALAAKG